MSAMNRASVCYPPQFPVQGRLPSRSSPLYRNHRQQNQMEIEYHDALSVAAGRRVIPPCCKTLHITLCFDGTGNNLNNDLYLSNPKHPTNIARMFRASIGAGYAGGTAQSASASRLTDPPDSGLNQFFKYYMPGVGTPFPEVGDLDYGTSGLAFASFGEERINWGLLMILDALRRALHMPRQDDRALLAAVRAMGSIHGLEALTGKANRRRVFYTQFWKLLPALKRAMGANGGDQCRILGVKLYVYGFSRGAAAARGFVNWLNELLSPTEAKPSLKMVDVALPIQVQYLGLIDTVASVGIADIIAGADGHMSWADGNQQIPEGDFVRRCLHIAASHEQRQCFPLESIRRLDGSYPPNCAEVIYPGVHSDQGGGYPPGVQGKAISGDDRFLLPQIALNDLYADAFSHGAPLKTPKEAIPIESRHDLWKLMEDDVLRAFDVDEKLINRFNAWRQVTLGLTPATQPLPIERAERYEPLTAGICIEDALHEQMAWITAWRIDRYAFASVLNTPFYLNASDTEADPVPRKQAENARNDKQRKIEQQRRQQLADERSPRVPRRPLPPGVPDFDPDMDQTQLREGAEEFARHYFDDAPYEIVIWTAGIPQSDGIAGQRNALTRLKKAGLEKVRTLFPRPDGYGDYPPDIRRGEVDESRNASQPEGLLRDLFDNQVHDSYAWFLYSLNREPWGSYLSERRVFFGETNPRTPVVYDENDQPMLAGDPRLPVSTQRVETSPPMMTPERLAEFHKAIDAEWAAYKTSAKGVSDGSV